MGTLVKLSTEFSTGIVRGCLVLVISLVSALGVWAQDTIPAPANDTLVPIVTVRDSLRPPRDTVQLQAKSLLDGPVHYQARDSIRMDLRSKKAFLYGNSGEATIDYTDMNIKAAYIEVDFGSKRLDASGLPDSTGRMAGTPVFKQGEQEFRAKQMSYNFENRKGLIREVITNEGEGYIHGHDVKRLPSEDYFISKGKYTTCNLDHPHFEIQFSKAKMTRDKKIVTGPAWLVVQDIPTPLAIPFGYFPGNMKRSSGILMPTYGESANRGFYFENLGYYFALNEHYDLALKGDIYTRGSWALKAESNYRVRYKYSGRLAATYATNIFGDKGTPEYDKNKDFRIEWVHSQDPKARPNSQFSANVKAGTQKFNNFNPTNTNDYLSNTFNSSISYSTNLAGRLKLAANVGLSQNTGTGDVTLTAPRLNLSSGRFYPLKAARSKGKARWYEKISVNYTMDAKNTVTTVDSLFWSPEILNEMEYGVKHYIPIAADFKILKHLNLTMSANYTERWYWQTIRKQWSNSFQMEVDGEMVDTFGVQTIIEDGFKAARDYNAGASLNTRLYGYLDITRGPIASLRHVISPSVALTYQPDYTAQHWGYYRYYLDEDADLNSYTIFDGSVYGGPQGGKSGNVRFALTNNLEAKLRSKSDSTEALRKIRLIDNLSIGTSYNLAADSLNWAPLTVNMRTLLFRKINLTYTASYDFYVRNPETNQYINQYVWDVDGRLLRLNNFSTDFSISYSLNSNNRKKGDDESLSPEERDYLLSNFDNFVDFDNPWNLTIDYSFRYGERVKADRSGIVKDVTHTLNLNGSVNLTPKWKVGVRSGYDFIRNEFTYTSVDVYRDLHCWEMTFNWIPTGFRKSYNFTLRVKASMLQDLKLTKKTDFRDLYF